jgi:aminoglycoside phosphotransferase (APT) family kinase protein
LLHLDYHLFNVLVEHGRVSAVLDWTNARAGDPRADLARTHTILLVDPGTRRLPAYQRAMLALFERAWQSGYRSVAGPPGEMALFYAWAGAVMQRDLAPRVGQPSGPTAREMLAVRRWAERWRRRAGV